MALWRAAALGALHAPVHRFQPGRLCSSQVRPAGDPALRPEGALGLLQVRIRSPIEIANGAPERLVGLDTFRRYGRQTSKRGIERRKAEVQIVHEAPCRA